ncbi:MAG TPA: GyrI-like domain-containing protein [Stenotrophomonas sp.]|nr:GyrI-like domain-containing protein [Stenotrophomonas sp.]
MVTHKVDFKRELKPLYQASAGRVDEVDVPSLRFLMIDGEGDPNGSASYAAAVAALFSVSWTAKFMIKREQGIDHVVMPLEGMWWADDLSTFVANDRSKWKWTMMILQPDTVDDASIGRAVEEVVRRKQLAAARSLRLQPFTEGRCAQTLHVGPFSEEGPTIQRVHEYIRARGSLAGKHHEIYLSDVRRAAPSRWRTIIRQPLAPR